MTFLCGNDISDVTGSDHHAAKSHELVRGRMMRR
jgi:hypothetical protein